MVEFGVERHTLVTEDITQVFHHSSAVAIQVPATKADLFRVREQILRRFTGSTFPFQREFKDSPLTQLRGRKGTYFSWFLVKFWRRNNLGRYFRTLGVRNMGRTHSGSSSDHQFISMEILSTHFTVEPRISLKHTSTNSDSGITRVQFFRVEGAHFPQGDPSGNQIHQLRSEHSSRLWGRSRRIVWDNSQALLRGIATRENFPSFQQLPYVFP